MTTPQQYKARVSEKYFLTDNKKYILVKLEFIKPKVMDYRAGQYITLKINSDGERRSYSIATAPDVQHGLTLVVEITQGKGGQFLLKLEVGDEVELMGPLGVFGVDVKRDNNKQNKLFVATGSGVVPIKAMIEDLLINQRYKGQLRLHWGMRNEEDLFWFDNFERLVDEYNNFVFDQVLSKPNESWSLCSGHVQDCLKRDFEGKSLQDWEAYICGNPKMVAEVEQELIELGMEKESVFRERFV